MSLMQDQIEALRQAIDMSEKNVRVSDKHRHDPVPNDYDRSIHNNPDAQAWARFFINTVADQSWRIEDIDEGLMTGWFANAMMAMHDHVKREWVGLTEQDVHDAFQFTELIKQLSFDRERPEWCENFAAYLEAKLREKNGG